MYSTEHDEVILVDENDVAIGTLDKLEAHLKGKLHRAFSIFIFNTNGEMMLQRRALDKYHSGGLWSNACCSHPRPGEATIVAAQRRLLEEMGFTTDLEEILNFTYRAELENGIIEHEFDHVFVGSYNGPVLFNTSEVHEISFLSIEQVKEDIENYPDTYTVWFRECFGKVCNWYQKNNNNEIVGK